MIHPGAGVLIGANAKTEFFIKCFFSFCTVQCHFHLVAGFHIIFQFLTQEGKLPVPDFASCDVSFISLSKILPAAFEIIKPGAEMVCLIKPQFEAGREKVGKKGVVRDPAVHQEVIRAALSYAAAQGFETLGLDYSPIRGPEGNIEYLMYIRKPGVSGGEVASKTGLSVTAHDYTDQEITALVTASHAAFSSAGGNPDHE